MLVERRPGVGPALLPDVPAARYRLIDDETGGDIGPLISARLTFAVGEVTAPVEPESETFRAYIVVRGS